MRRENCCEAFFPCFFFEKGSASKWLFISKFSSTSLSNFLAIDSVSDCLVLPLVIVKEKRELKSTLHTFWGKCEFFLI